MTDLPPGPSLPPAEQSLRLLKEPEDFLAECARSYGDTFTVRLAFLPPIVFLSHPDTVAAEVFRMDGDKDRFRAGEGNAKQLLPLGPDSVLLLDGRQHTRMRRVLGSLWHEDYVDIVRRSVARTVDRWRRGDRISIRGETERIALDVSLSATLGLPEGKHRNDVRALLVRWLSTAGDVPKFLLGFAPLMKEVDAVFYREIAERRRSGTGGRNDLLSKLVRGRDEDGSRLTDSEIRDQLVTLIAAGHDTSASVLAWAFFHLFTEPSSLARLCEELAQKLRGRQISQSDLSPQAVPYLTAVLDETMRLHPVLSGVHRMLHRTTSIGRYTLPKGVIVAPCIYLAHRRPDVWREPERFVPERFLDGPIRKGAFFPFGGGVRACLGRGFALSEMKIVVYEVLRRARLRIDPGYRPRAARRGVTHVPDQGIPAVVIEA
jgi:cytochrome P450